jgi:hypothetical protein
MCEGCPRDGVPEMTTQSAQFEPVEDLREHFEVPKELPRELRTLVRKLDDTPSPLWSSLRELHNGPPPRSNSWLAELAAEWDGRFALNREIPVCAGLRGGAGRTRTFNQTFRLGLCEASLDFRGHFGGFCLCPAKSRFPEIETGVSRDAVRMPGSVGQKP